MVFSMFMTKKKKKKIVEPSISMFTSCFDTIMLFHMKHLFSITSAAGQFLNFEKLSVHVPMHCSSDK